MNATPIFPGYEITKDGEVYSISHNWRGHGRRLMRAQLNSYGYPSVRVTIDGKRARRVIHVLVARQYLGDRPSPAHQVRHLNGNRTDNRVSNLAWGTAKENADDRQKHGNTVRGERLSLIVRRGRVGSVNPHWKNPDVTSGALLGGVQ